MILVDTSVRVEFFRRGTRLELEAWASLDEVVTCLPVLKAVLRGFVGEAEFRVARDAIHAFPIVESPLRTELFEDAVGLYRSARRAGHTVRSSVDCLIAACALRNDLEVLHDAPDFGHLAAISPLRERRVTRR